MNLKLSLKVCLFNMGIHTSRIVNSSKIPVLVLPSYYRAIVLKKVSYLSNFENLKKEIDNVFVYFKMRFRCLALLVNFFLTKLNLKAIKV